MSKTITSRIIGQLKQDRQFPEFWESDEVAVPFFNKAKLRITFDVNSELDPSFLTEADDALAHFLRLTSKDRDLVSGLVYKNCTDVLEMAEFDGDEQLLNGVTNETDIWKLVRARFIYVRRRPYNDQDVYVQVACECDWEEEHGLLLVFRQGKKLTRVSEQDGHLTEADAYGKSDEEDELLAAFWGNSGSG